MLAGRNGETSTNKLIKGDATKNHIFSAWVYMCKYSRMFHFECLSLFCKSVQPILQNITSDDKFITKTYEEIIMFVFQVQSRIC